MATNKTNFRCPKTGKEFFIAEYKIVFGSTGKQYKTKFGDLIVNPENNEPLEAIERDGEFNVSFGKVSSMTPAERKKVMKKRSADHNASQKDRWHSINRGEKQ